MFYTDGDAQYDPHDLLRLLAVGLDDFDIVTGYKIARHDPLYRCVFGWLYREIVQAAVRLRVRDVDCDFRLMRRSVLDSLQLESDTGTICVELVRKLQDAGCRIAEVPVPHYYRTYGTSQFFQVRHLWRIAGQLAGLWWNLVAHRQAPRTIPVAES